MSTQIRDRKTHIAIAVIGVTLFTAIVITLLHTIHDGFNEPFAYTAIIGVLGTSIGAALGFTLSPFSERERHQFTNMQTTVVGFVTGYGASKLESSINYLFNDAKMFTDHMVGLRVLVFVMSLAVSTLFTYVYRKYYIAEDLGIAADDARMTPGGAAALNRDEE